MSASLAIGAAALLAARTLLQKGSRAKTPYRTLIGSEWHDSVSGRAIIRNLARALKPSDRERVKQWVEYDPNIIEQIFDRWEELHEDAVQGNYLEWRWAKKRDALSKPIPFTREEAQQAAEDGYAEGLVDKIPDEILEIIEEVANGYRRAGEQPPSEVFGPPTIYEPGWLVHHSNATDLDQTGFRIGVQDIMGLAYTGGGSDSHGTPGFNFGYEPDTHETYGYDHGRPKYGKYIYVFWVPAYVRAYHHGDREPQAIFWGPSARNIIEVNKDGDDKWMISVWDRSPRFDDLDSLTLWLDSNLDQYRKILTQDLDVTRRRVSRGWHRERGRRQESAYKGPGMGSGNNPMDVIEMALPAVSPPKPGTRPRWARSWEKGAAWARGRLSEAPSRYDLSQPLSALHPEDQRVLLDNLMGLPSLDVLEGRLRPGLLYYVRPLLVRQIQELGQTANRKLKENMTVDQRAFWFGVRDYVTLCQGVMTAPAAMQDVERLVDAVEAALVREWLRRRRAGDSAGSRARSNAPSWIELPSDLFQESGHNATEEAVARGYAGAMREMGGWGKFPPILAWIGTVDEDDLEKYQEAERGGYEHELAWSRPLRRADLGKDYARVVDGHHRAHAARAVRVPLRVEPLSWGPSGARPWTTQELDAYRAEQTAVKPPR